MNTATKTYIENLSVDRFMFVRPRIVEAVSIGNETSTGCWIDLKDVTDTVLHARLFVPPNDTVDLERPFLAAGGLLVKSPVGLVNPESVQVTIHTHNQGLPAIEPFDAVTDFTIINADTSFSVDSINKKEGSNSMIVNKVGTSGVQLGVSKTYTNPKNLLGMKQLRIFGLIPTPSNLTAAGLRIRLGRDASNYFEWLIDPTTVVANTWNEFKIKLESPTSTTGTPVLGSITYAQFAYIFASSAVLENGYRFDALYFD